MENNDLYGTQITLLVGDAGSGKTWYGLNHPEREKAFYLDLEHRYQETLKFHPEIRLPEFMLKDIAWGAGLGGRWKSDNAKSNVPGTWVETKWQTCAMERVIPGTYTNALIYTKDNDIDHIKTWDNVDKLLSRAIKTGVKLIVIDGIQDLRRMATDKYEIESGKTAYGQQAWSKINSMVKQLLYRAFNFARINNIQVLITTHYAPEFTDQGERTGKVYVDAKDYIVDRVDEVLGFKRDGMTFTIRRGKSPKGPCEPFEWGPIKKEEEGEASEQ